MQLRRKSIGAFLHKTLYPGVGNVSQFLPTWQCSKTSPRSMLWTVEVGWSWEYSQKFGLLLEVYISSVWKQNEAQHGCHFCLDLCSHVCKDPWLKRGHVSTQCQGCWGRWEEKVKVMLPLLLHTLPVTNVHSDLGYDIQVHSTASLLLLLFFSPSKNVKSEPVIMCDRDSSEEDAGPGWGDLNCWGHVPPALGHDQLSGDVSTANGHGGQCGTSSKTHLESQSSKWFLELQELLNLFVAAILF